MKMQVFRVWLVLVMLVVGALEAAADTGSTASDRTELKLTLYQDGLVLVREQRWVELLAGSSRLALTDVPVRLLPETARLESEGGLSVKEHQFRYDLATHRQLLERYIGQTIELVRPDPAGGAEIRVPAELLAVRDGVPYYRLEGRIERLGNESPWRISFPAGPQLILQPVLQATVESSKGGRQPLELLYLSEGLRWETFYTARLQAETQTLDLEAQVRVSNDTGMALRNADAQLVVGEVRRAREPARAIRAERMDAAVGQAEPQGLSGYRMYRLPQKVDLEQGEARQIPLFAYTDIPVQREFRVAGIGSQPQPDERTVGAELRLRLDNREPALGVALPPGLLRAYTRDADGYSQLLGETPLDSAPVGKTLELTLGRAVDISAHRVQTGFRRLGEQGRELSWRLTVRNAGEAGAEVVVEETFHGDWQIIEANLDHEQATGQTARWQMEVPPGGESVLTYTVEVR